MIFYIQYFQVESRDREIVRLNQLLIGGRPVSALGKDCCYRGTGKLSDDVDALQRDKVALQKQLKETVSQQHEAMQRALKLGEDNNKLEKELSKIEGAAMQVEAEANRKFASFTTERSTLQVFAKSTQMISYNHYTLNLNFPGSA